jgi:hypothetical protein
MCFHNVSDICYKCFTCFVGLDVVKVDLGFAPAAAAGPASIRVGVEGAPRCGRVTRSACGLRCRHETRSGVGPHMKHVRACGR